MKSISLISAGLVTAALSAGATAAEMTLFDNANFHGEGMTLRGDIFNLDRTGMNDRVSSIIVRSGRWEVCTDSNFGGYCSVLGPGEYAQLREPLHDRISSARVVAPTVSSLEPGYRTLEPGYRHYSYNDPRFERYDDRGRYGALEVYTLPGFRGSTMKFDRSATSLDRARTEEGVGSLVVREGVWEVCTGLDFNGTCRVYEPGRYARLGSFEGAPIGSLRRIG